MQFCQPEYCACVCVRVCHSILDIQDKWGNGKLQNWEGPLVTLRLLPWGNPGQSPWLSAGPAASACPPAWGEVGWGGCRKVSLKQEKGKGFLNFGWAISHLLIFVATLKTWLIPLKGFFFFLIHCSCNCISSQLYSHYFSFQSKWDGYSTGCLWDQNVVLLLNPA